jgi:hypothetical protein
MDEPKPKETEATNQQQAFLRDLWTNLKKQLGRARGFLRDHSDELLFYVEVAALIGLALYVYQTKRTNDLTQDALKTSKDQFQVTLSNSKDQFERTLSNSRDQFRIDQRPYVWVSELGPFIRAPHSTGDTSDKLAFQFKLTNYGKSPAIRCQVDARIAIGKNAWKQIVWKSLDADKGSILPPGKVEVVNDAFSDQAVSEEFFKQVISPGKMEPIEVLGHIQYIGNDGTPYSSDFCFGRNPAPGLYNCPYHNEIK